jgi:tol-pal system protein YbgF
MKTVGFVVLAALAAPGCFWATTKSEGEKMQKDITALQTRLDTKEQTLDDQIAELKRVLDESSKLLKRNSADLGADVGKLRDDVRVAQGLVTTVNHSVDELKAQVQKDAERIAQLEQRLAAIENKGPNPANPTSPDEMWSFGKTAFEAGRWDEARDMFRKLVTGFPTHVKAGEAQYFRAEAIAKKGDADTAIGEYQKMYEQFPSHQLADDALFRAGEVAYSLKNCTEARAYFGTLKQKYPKSNLIKQAEAKDKEIKGVLKTKSKCTS